MDDIVYIEIDSYDTVCKNNESLNTDADDCELIKLEEEINQTNMHDLENKDIFKALIEFLENQISRQIEEINYLRSNSKSQDNIIHHLLGIITTQQINNSSSIHHSCNNSIITKESIVTANVRCQDDNDDRRNIVNPSINVVKVV